MDYEALENPSKAKDRPCGLKQFNISKQVNKKRKLNEISNTLGFSRYANQGQKKDEKEVEPGDIKGSEILFSDHKTTVQREQTPL